MKKGSITGKKIEEIKIEDLRTLGIDEKKFRNLTPKEQKEFLRLHALEDSILLKNRKERPRPDMNRKYKTSFRQILSFLWVPYKGLFIFSLVMSFIQSGLFLTLPIMLQKTIDDLLTTRSLTLVYKDMGLTVFFMLTLAFVMYIRIYTNQWIGNNIIKDLRDAMYRKFQSAKFEFYDKHSTGDLIARTTADINLLKNLLASEIAVFIRQVLLVLFSIAAMFYINPTVASYAVIPIPIAFIIMLYYRSKIRPLFRLSRDIYGELTAHVQENITGMRVVRAFAQEEEEIKKFKRKNTEYYNQNQKLILYQSSFEPIVRLLSNISIIIVLSVGTSLVIKSGSLTAENSMTVGDLFAFVMLINFSIEPLFFISRFLANMSKIDATCDRVTEILNNDIEERTEHLPDFPPIKGHIVFKDVWLSYEHNDHYELKGINLEVRPGEQLAILGATGSGKSSLIRLIPHFYDISKGKILIDGKDITQYNPRSIRKQIGIVPQETFLFARTIWENLTLGNPDATMEEVTRATKLANIHDFIESLPDKYETVIGERGVTVSGGQKQRLAIARALIVKPRILILDDATSSVDVDTEYEIQKSFQEMFENATIFIITQRLSTVRNADRIIVLEHGKIAEMGTHEELMKKPEGIYSKLYRTLHVEEWA